MLRLALKSIQANEGKLDMGALMKQAMASPAIAEHKKDAPKYAQKLAKAAHSLSAEALGQDEFETLTREKEYLADALRRAGGDLLGGRGGGGPQGQEQAGGAGEAGDLY